MCIRDSYKIPGNDDAIRSVALLTRVIADAVAAGLRRCEHWEIVPREGKAALVAVDVLDADAVATDCSQHTLVVRDRAGAWTPDFRAVRDALGMPSTPPRAA